MSEAKDPVTEPATVPPEVDPLVGEAAAAREKAESQDVARKAEIARLETLAAEGALRAFMPIAEAELTDAGAIMGILADLGKLEIGPEGVRLIGSDGAKVPATAEGLAAAAAELSPSFTRSKCLAGSGGRSPREFTGSSGADLSLVGDREHWKRHRAALQREYVRRKER